MTPCFPIYDRRLRPAFGRRDAFEGFGCLVRRRLDCLFGDLDRPLQITEPCLAWRGASRPSGHDHSGPRLRRHGQWLAHEIAGSPLAVMGDAVPMPLIATIVCCSSPACTGAGGSGERAMLRPVASTQRATFRALRSSSIAARVARVAQRRVTASDADHPARNHPDPCVRRFARGCSAFVGPMGSAGLVCPLS